MNSPQAAPLCGSEAASSNARLVTDLFTLAGMRGASIREIADFTLDEATVIAESPLGFLGFLDEQEHEVIIHAWTRSFMAECRIDDKPLVFAVEKTGWWGDAIRERRPIIVNDYSTGSASKKGTPEGHVHIERFMSVPVFSNERIAAVLGVANKAEPYKERDAANLQLLLAGMLVLFERNSELVETAQKLKAQIQKTIKAEHQAEHTSRYLEFVLESTGTQFVILDQEHGVLATDPVTLQTRGSFAGRRCHDYLFGDPLSCPDCRCAQALAFNERLTLDKVLPGSTHQHVQVSYIPFTDQDGRWLVAHVLMDISARKQAELALRASEGRLRSVFEGSHDAILLFDDYGIIDCNDRAVALFGYTNKVRFRSLAPRALSPHSPAEEGLEPAAFEAAMREAAATGSSRFVHVFRRANGATFVAETSFAAFDYDGKRILQAAIRDITTRVAAEAAMRIKDAAIDNAIDGIALADLTGSITFVNSAFCRLWSLARADEALGRPLPAFWRHAKATAVIGSVREHGAWKGELQAIKRQGETFDVQASVSLVRDDKGRPSAIMASFVDIADRKQLESQLLHAQKLEAVGQLAAGIAHEINTPMQYIGDNTHFLQDAFGDLSQLVEHTIGVCQRAKAGEPVQALTAQIETALADADWEYLQGAIPPAIGQSLEGIARVTEIVRAMKDFSHPGTGEKVATDLNRAIQSTVTIARNEWKYVAEMAMDLSPDLPLVECLPGEINQVLLNLLVNAAHAIADRVAGSGDKGQITIATRANDEFVRISVNDTGSGMSPEVQRRIFEPFFTTKAVGKGTGQGLTLAYNVVVRHHGGQIDVKSAEGKGTTFLVTLPIAAAPESAPSTEQLPSGKEI